MGIIKDPKSWRTGFELGLAGFSFPYSKPRRKPPAYLYNGIRLPALPEWDKVMYPYAFIETTFGLYYLRVLANPLTPDGDSFRFNAPGLVAGAQIDVVTGGYSGWNGWSEVTDNTRTPIWSNYDVLTADGTVFLAASDPVPVYE